MMRRENAKPEGGPLMGVDDREKDFEDSEALHDEKMEMEMEMVTITTVSKKTNSHEIRLMTAP